MPLAQYFFFFNFVQLSHTFFSFCTEIIRTFFSNKKKHSILVCLWINKIFHVLLLVENPKCVLTSYCFSLKAFNSIEWHQLNSFKLKLPVFWNNQIKIVIFHPYMKNIKLLLLMWKLISNLIDRIIKVKPLRRSNCVQSLDIDICFCKFVFYQFWYIILWIVKMVCIMKLWIIIYGLVFNSSKNQNETIAKR